MFAARRCTLLFALAALVALGPGCPNKPSPNVGPLVKAHRGASAAAPENTLAAITLAWERGANAVEIDVHLSADRQPVVIHDADTRRVGGRDRRVSEQTLAELRELDVGRWRGDAFAGERIPTLAEALATIPPTGTLFVEIKSDLASVPIVLAAIENSAHRGRVAIESANADVLDDVRRRDPRRATYWTLGAQRKRGVPQPIPAAVVASARRAGYTGLALDVAGVTPDLLRAARAANLEVGVWTVDDPALAKRLAPDVRWIETNRVDAVVRALKER